jgi:hypothetical protein
MDEKEFAGMFWTAISTIYIGGLVLYFLGDRPDGGFSAEIIPVSEPTAIDWAQVGGIMFLN